MLKVSLGRLQETLDLLRKINETKIEDIIWLDNAVQIKISNEDITKFKYTGLNNVDFARSYKGWVK